MVELGLFAAYADTIIPAEATWIVAAWRGYTAPSGQKVILHDSDGVGRSRPIVTASDLAELESKVMLWDLNKFWGVIFLSGEWYKSHIQFENGMNYTWFGQWLCGYDVWLETNPDWTEDRWRGEMYYRMLHGFYSYFKAQGVKVGQTMGMNSVLPTTRDYYFGAKAWGYIRDNSDFIVFYTYTKHLDHWNRSEKQYFDYVDELMKGGAKPFFILTMRWHDQPYYDDWKPEAIALEMKNALDRNMVICVWREASYFPDHYANWQLALKSIELYDARAPYTESLVHDTNLLTGYTNLTYGWVANPEHDEGLYPTPLSPLDMLIRAALSAAGAAWLILSSL